MRDITRLSLINTHARENTRVGFWDRFAPTESCLKTIAPRNSENRLYNFGSTHSAAVCVEIPKNNRTESLDSDFARFIVETV